MADSCAAEGAKALHLFFKPCGDLAQGRGHVGSFSAS